MSFNTSIQVLPIAWNSKRFNESKSARDAARRSIFRATTTLINSEFKILESQNNEINHEIDRCRNDLHKYNNKLQILDNMTQLATQSLEVYFQARMENLRAFVTEQCRIISDGIQEEADHWKEIHAMLQQKLVVPGDLRSYGGGNGLPRPVKQSPNFSRIVEEEEPEEEEQEEKAVDVTTLLQSRSLTPLLTQTLKKARLLSSKLSRKSSTAIRPELNMSTTVVEETIIEEPAPTTANTSDNHVTLRDVSAIEKAIEPEHEIPNHELSASLLPFMPTTNVEEEKQNNKSVTSTISDKTFVKTSLRQFSSDEDSDEDEDDEDEDDETIVEDSFSTNVIENKRPLLLTADRSIRRVVAPIRTEKHSLSHIMSIEEPKIKKEKVSVREALPIENNQTIAIETTKIQSEGSFREPLPVEKSQTNTTLTSENSSIHNGHLSHVHSTTIGNSNTSKLSPIKSDNENEEEEEEKEKQDVIQPLVERSIPEQPPKIESKPKKSPIIENPSKRRTTRRTTIRVLRENQNDNIPAPVVEIPTKTRYQTRYSTRLAAAVIHEDVTITRKSTVHRRTKRFTSE